MNIRRFLAFLSIGTMLFSTSAFADEKKDENINDAAVEAVTEIKSWNEYFVISHACGAVDGRCETNSLEAFEQNYEKGQRVFEIDFSLTLDEKLVARHDFEQNSYYVMEQSYFSKVPVMMYDKFMNTPINYKYTPMDAAKIVELLKTHKDAYIVTDSKNTDKGTVEKEFLLLTEAIVKGGDAEVFDRVVVQLYHPEMIQYVKNTGPYTNFMLTTYQIANPDFSVLSLFCKENGVDAIVMPYEVLTKEKADTIHSAGLELYTHTVNRLYDTKKYMEMYGIDGIYSDIIVEEDIKYITEKTTAETVK